MADQRHLLRLDALSGVPHGFTTGFGDAGPPDAARLVDGGTLVLCEQVHSADVVVADKQFDVSARPKGDALVTDRRGLVLSIVTADCVPVLLADPVAGVVGAVHAGWRGAKAGIIERAVDAMCDLGAQRARVVAGIGPCIHQASYEVDETFRTAFGQDSAQFFAPGREAHWQFDLPGYVDARLASAGVRVSEHADLDTYAHPGLLHSYRRAVHEGRDTTGRQYSLIAVP